MLISYVIFEFILASLNGNEILDISPVVAAVAFIHVVYAYFIYNRIAGTKPELAGTISFVLFGAIAYLMIRTTAQDGIHYTILWSFVLMFSGMFGILQWGLTVLVTAVLFILYASGVVTAHPDFNYLLLFVNVLIAALSLFIWRGTSSDQMPGSGDKGTKINSQELRNKVNVEALIDSIVDGVVIIDNKNIIQVFSPAAQTITGWKSDEAINLDFRSVFKFVSDKGQAIQEGQDPISLAFSNASAQRDKEAFIKSRSQNSIEIDIIASPIKDGDTLIAIMAIFRDVSKERSEERQRAEFISTASHEMRTPVAAIEGYLALAMNDKVSKIDTVARGYLEKAHSSTKQLGKLFQDLLTAAKSEDGRLSNHPVVIEIGQFLRDLTESVRFTAEKKGLRVEYAVGTQSTASDKAATSTVSPIYYIHADPDRLREVLINLFDNAVKYTDDGKITIGLTSDQQNVILSLTDTGAGIPKDDIPHLFQKFYRVDNTATRQVGGTGLGLFICKKIIELYKGKIWVESEINQGSTFFISLPKLSSEQAQEMMKQEASAKSVLEQHEELIEKKPETTLHDSVTVTAQAAGLQPVDPSAPPKKEGE